MAQVSYFFITTKMLQLRKYYFSTHKNCYLSNSWDNKQLLWIVIKMRNYFLNGEFDQISNTHCDNEGSERQRRQAKIANISLECSKT